MVQTYGLTHLNLAVNDTQRALRFYEQVFGLREYGRGDGLVHTQAPGRHDILTFVEDPTTAGAVGGIAHFGFRLVDPRDVVFPDITSIDLGRIDYPYGAMSLPVHAKADAAKNLRSVVLWDAKLKRLHGFAQLSARQ